jgi:hypothetical protein
MFRHNGFTYFIIVGNSLDIVEQIFEKYKY